jgi:hypothetical protein
MVNMCRFVRAFLEENGVKQRDASNVIQVQAPSSQGRSSTALISRSCGVSLIQLRMMPVQVDTLE